jgi:hypothetical protein
MIAKKEAVVREKGPEVKPVQAVEVGQVTLQKGFAKPKIEVSSGAGSPSKALTSLQIYKEKQEVSGLRVETAPRPVIAGVSHELVKSEIRALTTQDSSNEQWRGKPQKEHPTAKSTIQGSRSADLTTHSVGSKSETMVSYNEYSSRTDYPHGNEYSSDVRSHSPSGSRSSAIQSHSGDIALRMTANDRPTMQIFNEAFDADKLVQGVRSRVLTLEDKNVGWRIYRAQDHWNTVSRTTSESVPFLAPNSVQLLGYLSGSKIEKEAGIVFGKVPSGWTVHFSGRSERGIFLNEERLPVSSADVSKSRYFAFVNSAPGAQFLELKGHGVSDRGVLAIPVLAGSATYVDLSDLSIKTFSGFVYDGGESKPAPLSGVHVRLSGIEGEDTITDSAGHFEIPGVLTVSDHPIYVETDSVDGFTHRYEVSPAHLSDKNLFRLSERQIQTWIDQLEGGISPESGLLVAAVSAEVTNKYVGQNLTGQVSTLTPFTNLIPEVYQIAASGQLQIEEGLDNRVPRFLAVQLPEGPATAEVFDKNQKLIWSRLFVAQPRIINIVGP